MGDLNVFDEWGNYVGRFTPAGGGCLETIALILAMIVFWTIGFILFAAYKGIVALLNGEWTKAFLNLLPISLCILFVIFSVASAAASEAARKKRWETVSEEATWALKNPNKAFTIRQIEDDVWSIANNLDQVVRGGHSTKCAPYESGEVVGIHIPSFASGETIMLKCDYEAGSGMHNELTLYGDSPWLEVGYFCLGLNKYHRCD